MNVINNYYLDKPLTSNNSGFSKWGIGKRDGKNFFIKEFLSPIYPSDDTVFSEAKKLARIDLCQVFVDEKTRLYQSLRGVNDGHITLVDQFFRSGTKYYISTRAIVDPRLSIQEINEFPFSERLRLCCSVAHSMSKVHEKGIVHADIKPDNILVIKTDCNTLQPNIIDFDCGFFEDNLPQIGDELNGDMVYLSPEGFLHIAGIESNLSCRMDVFALGLLFSQYLCGHLPQFDREEYQYPYEVVLDDKRLILDEIADEQCRDVIGRMLLKIPEERPDMSEVFEVLKEILLSMLGREVPEVISDEQPKEDSLFFPAGDL